MIILLFRKMLNTRWMVLCLLVGFIMAAAMMSTIPIYMDGSLQRMLIKDMQGYQLDTGEYPGEYSVIKKTPFGLDVSQQKEFAQNVIDEVSAKARAVDMPISTYKNTVRDDFLFLTVESRDVGDKAVRTKLVGMSEVEDHINIKRGRMYQQGLVDGAYEVIATDAVLQGMEVIEGREYEVSNAFDSSLPTFKVRIVGVYEPLSETDPYWAESQTSYLNSLILDYGTFINEVIFTGTSSLTDVTVQFAYDYQKMDLNKLSSVVSTIKADSQYYEEQDWTFSMGVLDILDDYAVRAAELKTILWLLQIPVMIMLAFYLFMVSQLNVEQEKNEIAVFKSRGASSKQIFGIYA
ncbi:MAG: ABC transporter permease, partial [Clostridiales bacterium]|nr:ABC transporter permease [Clostridiales bacterium]